jgi:hypothetical protein
MSIKRNTVSILLEQKDYDALKALAAAEDRNVSGQARHMLRDALHPEMPPAAHQNPTSATSDTPALSAPSAQQEPLPG